MKNLFLVSFVFISSLVFSQSDSIPLITGIYSYTYDCLYPKWPTDTNKFDGTFTTEKLSIAEPMLPNVLKQYSTYMTSSDSFTNEIVNKFTVDNPNNPSKITFSKTNIKLELYPCTKEKIIYTGLITNYADSAKYYITDSDLSVTVYYFGNSIEVVNFGINKITENTYKVAETWYHSTHNKSKKLNKIEVLTLWINKCFMNDFNDKLPNKNYAEELIKKDGFQFSFSKESHYYDSMYDRWSKETLFEDHKITPPFFLTD